MTSTWASLCPNGRDIFYEGDTPGKFRQQIIAEFGFDPDDGSGGWNWYSGWRFRCPPEHLDAIYGSNCFPVGS